jgi:hypothetical protein
MDNGRMIDHIVELVEQRAVEIEAERAPEAVSVRAAE